MSKKVVYVLLILGLIFTIGCEKSPIYDLTGKNIAILLGRDFEDSEFLPLYKLFTNSGANVFLISTNMGPLYGKGATKAEVTHLFSEISADMFDAIVVPGGTGVGSWPESQELLIAAEGKIIAGICSGVYGLGNAGLLQGKNATGHHAQVFVEQSGGIYTGKGVTRDGLIITAAGPSDAKKFAAEIAKALLGME